MGQLIGELDALLAERLLQGEVLTSLDLSPVPLLGVPGWWEENETPTFYDNTNYFRSARKKT